MEIGKKYNHLTYVGKDPDLGQRYGIFQCDCGKQKSMIVSNVKLGYSKTCGCSRRKDSPFYKMNKEQGEETMEFRNEYYVAPRKPRRGDIFWIAPSQIKDTVGHVQLANRPGIIVSDDDIVNKYDYSYEVVYLTTAPKFESPAHCTIESSGKPSTALCEQVQAISYEQIGRYIATCTDEEMDEIEQGIMASLALSPQSENTWSVDNLTTMDEPVGLERELKILREENERLRFEVVKAQHGEEVIEKLYKSLLNKKLRG